MTPDITIIVCNSFASCKRKPTPPLHLRPLARYDHEVTSRFCSVSSSEQTYRSTWHLPLNDGMARVPCQIREHPEHLPFLTHPRPKSTPLRAADCFSPHIIGMLRGIRPPGTDQCLMTPNVTWFIHLQYSAHLSCGDASSSAVSVTTLYLYKTEIIK